MGMSVLLSHVMLVSIIIDRCSSLSLSLVDGSDDDSRDD